MPPLRILLDECVDARLAQHIGTGQVLTVPEIGWSGLENGELLKRAQAEFDVFLTTDRNLAFQQNLQEYAIAVVVLSARSNRLQDLLPLLPKVSEALPDVKPRQLMNIS